MKGISLEETRPWGIDAKYSVEFAKIVLRKQHGMKLNGTWKNIHTNVLNWN
jgi:hypothetical protein